MSKYSDRHKTSATCASSKCNDPGVRLLRTHAGLNWYCEWHYEHNKPAELS